MCGGVGCVGRGQWEVESGGVPMYVACGLSGIMFNMCMCLIWGYPLLMTRVSIAIM